MKELKGRVAGDLCGTRLALVEELIVYSNRKKLEHMKGADEVEVI